MAVRLASPCRTPRCPKVARRSGRCPDCERAYEAQPQRRAVKRFYSSHAWRQLRGFILARDPVCTECRRAPSTEVDHVKPRSQGGSDDPSNLRGVCKPCHSRKTVTVDGGMG